MESLLIIGIAASGVCFVVYPWVVAFFAQADPVAPDVPDEIVPVKISRLGQLAALLDLREGLAGDQAATDAIDQVLVPAVMRRQP